MADELLFTAKGTNDPLIRCSDEKGHLIQRRLNGTSLVGAVLGTNGLTFPDVDDMSDNQAGDEEGVLIRPLRFPFDADGGMTWNADTALADNEDVMLHRFCIGLCEVYMLIDGQDTPIAVKRGNAVFSTSTDGSTNDSRDGAATINNAQGFEAQIGVSAEDLTTGDATSAANGTYFRVTI